MEKFEGNLNFFEGLFENLNCQLKNANILVYLNLMMRGGGLV